MAKKKRERVKKMVEDAREPFSLLETLKEEGMARATELLTAASFAARSVRTDKVLEGLREKAQALGLASRGTVESLEEKVEALEARIEELEARLGVGSSDE